jgi:hypothetical protein
LFNELRKADVLDLAGDPQEVVAFNVVISGYAPQYSKKIVEFLALLDLQMPADEPEYIVIPAYFAVKTKKARIILNELTTYLL